jgi:L-ascorbate metabolism protein UlaG (beta-lactamase superfamily)
MKLIYNGITIERRDLAGVKITHNGQSLCIDAVTDLNCDVLLYTHRHENHIPNPDLLNGKRVVSPFLGMIVKPGDTLELMSGVVVEVVDAYNITKVVNGSIPHPKGFGVGYVINIDGKTIYHMGDTDLVEEMGGLRKKAINILLIPIGGGTVMTPEEAADAVMLLRPTTSIPIHFTDRGFFVKFRDIVQPYTQVILL